MHRVQAPVLRAAAAISLNEPELARKLLFEARQIPLKDEEQAALAVEF